MERIRRDVAAIVAGLVVAVSVAAIIDGRELRRVRSIAFAYGHDDHESSVVFLLVVGSTFVFAAVALTALSLARDADRRALVVLLVLPASLFACLPVYWYIYRGTPSGWHISIAEEHRWAQPAGIAAALLAYGVARAAVSAIQNLKKRARSSERPA